MPAALRRNAVPLLLLAAIVYVFMAWTVPALDELRSVRAARVEAEAELERRWHENESLQTWVDGIENDRITRERVEDLERLSPDVTGPQEADPPPEPPSDAL